MNDRIRLTTACLMLAALAGVGIMVGCTAAEAKPVEVTYYYLPG
jgi:hypothetical protein